jgi:hypothetical protein
LDLQLLKATIALTSSGQAKPCGRRNLVGSDIGDDFEPIAVEQTTVLGPAKAAMIEGLARSAADPAAWSRKTGNMLG